jgi:hypothetical protein
VEAPGGQGGQQSYRGELGFGGEVYLFDA